MTIEELLKPRRKTIAPFPGMCFIGDGGFFVGEIFYPEFKHEKHFYNGVDVDSYPHLFKKLEWHDDVKWEDLPKYLKYIKEDGEIDFVLKVEKYINIKDTGKWWAFEYKWQNEPDIKRMSMQGWTPATEAEYINQNQPK